MNPSIVNSRRVIIRILSSSAIDFEAQPIEFRTRTGRNPSPRAMEGQRGSKTRDGRWE
ncbi:uncharacterized protein LACBIDRAFT_318106 [Laccaria bicolor S238N-H82]|uniref:Predicted protein n=1 Tax=Laccaria bicolor (strain S238N-H82 / ATCC MYA-4686) TaxID=486041 RepID=B0D602_LACBS|nr:uncharacterized protein LACBIDRAFT_318106 [Laccaria bicolor S238N-H82]EDR10113.1 predicted protein [Laccaria bicolor S238N-H82]|eukprot:XP_001879498.1 predicted protein [Laccaria bicolor S238N-H82]